MIKHIEQEFSVWGVFKFKINKNWDNNVAEVDYLRAMHFLDVLELTYILTKIIVSNYISVSFKVGLHVTLSNFVVDVNF